MFRGLDISDLLDQVISFLSETLVRLLVVLVQLQPAVCRNEHIAILLGAYSATRRRTGIITCNKEALTDDKVLPLFPDRGLLYLIFLYEQNEAMVGEYR